jgi:hypothetical protein
MPAGLPRVTVQLPAKPWWHSRTLWVNVLVFVLAAAESRLGLLQPLLPVNVYELLALLLPVVNAWLRLVTTRAVSLRDPAQAAPPFAQPPAPASMPVTAPDTPLPAILIDGEEIDP